MFNSEKAGAVWFGRNRMDDARYLQFWRSAPVTYNPDHQQNEYWNVDHYEIVLGKDTSGDLFQRASLLLLTNQFYPPEVMSSASDFGLGNRTVQPGDRVVQRIRMFSVAGKPVLEALTMNEISQVVQEDRRSGFTYSTTSAHGEIGEWAASVEWRDNNEVALVINVDSRARPGLAPLSRRFTRRMQLRAHRLGIANFVALLHSRPRRVRQAQFSAELLPYGLLLAAFGVVVGAVLGLSRKSKK